MSNSIETAAERFRLTVNGIPREIEAAPANSLLDVVREKLRLTGTKRGCGIGACGCCTVLVDGRPRRACLLPIAKVAGASVVTIEGLAGPDGSLHPIQQAFIDAGAVQCGYCTPGMILTAKALLDVTPHPDREQIRRALRGNLCRCTGYRQIIEAIELAAQRGRA